MSVGPNRYLSLIVPENKPLSISTQMVPLFKVPSPDDAVWNEDGYVHEEEVPRVGVRVQGLLRRARAYDGTPVVWHARRVSAGRGEARSGLAFDRIVET